MLNKFAEDLKISREKAGVNLIDIATETKLHSSIFEKLENGDFNFQPQTYIRAFLKQYAKYLKIDSAQILRDYDLAKAGKYTSKFSQPVQQPETKKQQVISEPEIKSPPVAEPERIEDVFETPPSVQHVNIETQEYSEDKQIYSSPRKIQVEKESFIEPPKDKKPLFDVKSIGGNKHYIKYAGITLVAIVVLIGLIFVVKSFFSGDSSSSDKIVKQNNYDSVSKEYEKSITGQTEQDKVDSIKKAKELLANNEAADSKLVMKVEAKDKGSVRVIEDDKDPKEVKASEFKKGDILTFRAKEKFFVSSSNTNSFTMLVNEKKINFKKKEARKVKIFLEKDKPKTDEK